MIPVLPTILAILIGVSFEEYYAETAMPEESWLWLLLSLPLCLAPVAATETLFRVARRRIVAGKPINVSRFWKLIVHMPLPLYVVALFVFGWPKIVVPLGIEGAVLVDQLIVLLPYFLCLAGAVVEGIRLRRPFNMTERGPQPAGFADIRAQLSEQARHIAIAVMPMLGLSLALDSAQDTRLRLYFDNLPLLSGLALVGVMAALSVTYPLLFRYGMGLKPLVAGAPLRKRLEELAAHLDFECRDILVWPTRRPVLNAAIIGVMPRYRFVIFTQELCNRLTLDELCAVFAHEVGHGKRHHALFYLMFSGVFLAVLLPASSLVGGFIEERASSALDSSIITALLFYLPAFAFYWIVLFSYISRRFELEADVFGVDTTGDAAMFIGTLEKVARIGRIERRTSALRHFSVAGRTNFLRLAYLDGNEGLLNSFRRRIVQLRKIVAVVFVLVLMVGGGWLFLDSMRGAALIMLERGNAVRARDLLQPYLAVRSSDPVAQSLLSESELYVDIEADSADPTGRWNSLRSTVTTMSSSERESLLDALFSGWARSVRYGRPDVGLLMVARAEDLNRASPAEPDPTLSGDLTQMRQVSMAIEDGDETALAAVTRHPPRWLRRPVVRGALEFLQELHKIDIN